MIPLNKNNNSGMVVVTTDGGAGSSGKGALNAWLATKYKFDLATNNWATNAGHFVEWFDKDKKRHRVLNQHICSAFFDPNVELYINPGASIDIKILLEEIRQLEKEHGFSIRDRLTIHPHANVITEEDKAYEKETIKSGSTFKGCGAALARKTMRIPGGKLAKDYDELQPYIKDRTEDINNMSSNGARILIEGSQGIDLDINFAEFPHVTSRQTHPTQLVADAGLPCQAITNVIINLRTNPIRINNQSAANDKEVCYTGNYWDAAEISWETVALRAGFASLAEFEQEYRFAMMTSVTKKTRRVFEFPKGRMEFVHKLVGGNLPFSHVLYSLNFINFIDRSVRGVTTYKELMTPKVIEWIKTNLTPIIGNKLAWIRTGPVHEEVVEINNHHLLR
jgi:adenylosuccinate synthase